MDQPCSDSTRQLSRNARKAREAHLKDRAFADLTHHAEMGVMHLGDPTGDGKTKTASLNLSTGLIGAKEA